MLAAAMDGGGRSELGIVSDLRDAHAAVQTFLANPVYALEQGKYRPIDAMADALEFQETYARTIATLHENGYTETDDAMISDHLIDLITICKAAGYYIGLALADAVRRGGKE